MTNNRHLPSPDGLLTALWARVPDYTRITFASAFICGLIAHLYMLTNKLPNHDDIGHLFEMDYGTASGRWLLPFVTRLDGTYSMPWLIGVLGLAALAAAACFVVSVLRIRNPAGCILTGALLTVFPTTAATFGYMFSADAYFISIALAAFGSYAAVRWRWLGAAVGVIAITCSMGIYQSYFGVAAALMVGGLLFDVLDGEKNLKELILKGIRLVAVLGIAMLAYIVIVKVTTRNMELVSYMGISDMGKLSLSQIPMLLVKCYGKFFTFYFKNDMGFHFGALRWLFALALAASGVLFILILLQRKLGGLRTALAVILAVLFPLAADIIYLMVPNGGVHTLMLYGLVFLTVAMVALADYSCVLFGKKLPAVLCPRRSLAFLMSWIVVLTAAIAAYSYVIVDNKAYFKLDISYQQAVSYSTRLLSAIEQADGYEEGMEVALVGYVDETAIDNPTPALNEVNMVGILDLAGYRVNYTYGHMLRYLLGFPGMVYVEGAPLVTELEKEPDVEAMPAYPAEGSIMVRDGMVVVKLG